MIRALLCAQIVIERRLRRAKIGVARESAVTIKVREAAEGRCANTRGVRSV